MLSIIGVIYQYFRIENNLCLASLLLIGLVVKPGGTMKTLLISISIVTTTLLTAVSFASPRIVSAPVRAVSYDQNSMIVHVSGVMPNLCASAPHPILQATAIEGALKLSVVAEMQSDVCIALAMVGGDYELAFDVRSLKNDLADLHINANRAYRIIAPNNSLVADVDFGKVSVEYPFATHKVAGGVFTVMNDGRYVVVVDKNTAFEVRSPFINLNKFMGHHVDVSGFVVTEQSYGIGNPQIERPLFLLTGLNTTP
jgi:hypothetical protein